MCRPRRLRAAAAWCHAGAPTGTRRRCPPRRPAAGRRASCDRRSHPRERCRTRPRERGPGSGVSGRHSVASPFRRPGRPSGFRTPAAETTLDSAGDAAGRPLPPRPDLACSSAGPNGGRDAGRHAARPLPRGVRPAAVGGRLHRPGGRNAAAPDGGAAERGSHGHLRAGRGPYPGFEPWTGPLNHVRALAVFTSSYERAEFEPGGRAGSVEAVLHPLLWGTFAYSGMQVLEPFIAYAADSVDEDTRTGYLDALRRRMAGIGHEPA